MKLEIHTLRFGQSEWLTQCQPTIESYVRNHGMPLHVWDDRPRGYPCVKFCEIDMIRKFLEGNPRISSTWTRTFSSARTPRCPIYQSPDSMRLPTNGIRGGMPGGASG
jgi:hypothetical protein